MNLDAETMKKRKRARTDIHGFIKDLESSLNCQESDLPKSLRQGSHSRPSRVTARNSASQNRATMNVAAPEKQEEAPPEPGPFMALPPMELIAGGLDTVDPEILRQSIDPIWQSLESLDAMHLLDLKQVPEGARVTEGVYCQPIHDMVLPVKHRRGSCVRYVHVSEIREKYSVGIFIFPPHARIPLHDHPGMCVLSRVLYGDVNRISLDLVRENDTSWFSWARRKSNDGSRRALLNGMEHLQAPDVTVLYPYEGNLHEFVAGPHGAAVLDVLLPPYDEDHHRDCTFYHIKDAVQPQGPCWIVPTGQPEDFHCLSGRYRDLGGDDFDDDDDDEA